MRQFKPGQQIQYLDYASRFLGDGPHEIRTATVLEPGLWVDQGGDHMLNIRRDDGVATFAWLKQVVENERDASTRASILRTEYRTVCESCEYIH